MTLREWKEKYEVPHDVMCEKLQVSRTHLYAMLAGRPVGLEHAIMIVFGLTGGEVTFDDLLTKRKKLPAGRLINLESWTTSKALEDLYVAN